jgi:hypothetical protein
LISTIVQVFSLYRPFRIVLYTYSMQIPMSMLKDYRSSIEELTACTPKKKAALIRSLLPTIEAALRSGQTLKDIWGALDKQGLDISYHVFQMTLWRARKRKAGTALGRGKNSEPSQSQPPPDGDVPAPEAHDPLANLRRLEANRPGFHWRPTPTRKEP